MQKLAWLSTSALPGASSSARRMDASDPRQSRSCIIWTHARPESASGRSGSSASACVSASRARPNPSAADDHPQFASAMCARPSSDQASANSGSTASACLRYPMPFAVSSLVV